MPIRVCSVNGKSGFKWGNSGKCYTGPGARKKAAAQAAAIFSAGYSGEGMGKKVDMKEALELIVELGGLSKAVAQPWDEKDDYIHYRVHDPSMFQPNSYATITIKKDDPKIVARIARPKGKTTTTVQVLLFPKPGWTKKSAAAWISKHPNFK